MQSPLITASFVSPHSEGGFFKAHLIFPREYPLRPPKMKFITDIWHPNSKFLLFIDLFHQIINIISSMTVFVLSQIMLFSQVIPLSTHEHSISCHYPPPFFIIFLFSWSLVYWYRSFNNISSVCIFTNSFSRL